MKKKVLSMFLAGAMLLSLAGCGSSPATQGSSEGTSAADSSGTSSEESSDSAGSSSSGEGTTMVFAWWGNQTRNEYTQAALDLYSEQNPGVTFDSQPAAWNDYWSKLSTMATGKTLPECLAMDYTYVEQYVSNGLLADLTPYVESGLLDVSNVDEGILASGSIDGRLYAVCAGINAPAVLYNKTLLDELEIEIKDNMTMDEFMAIAREVYEKTGVKTDLSYGSADNFMPYILRANGTTQLFNTDSLNVDEAGVFEEYFSLYETGFTEGWMLGADVFAELTIASVEESPLVFYSSPATQSWCGFFWSNQLTAMRNAAPEGMEIGMTTWPSSNPAQSNFLKPSQFYAVSRDAGENEEEAVKVMNFLLNSVEGNECLKGERGVPASSVVADEIAPILSETDQEIINYINNVVTPNSSPISPAVPAGASEAYAKANELVEAIFYGQVTAQQAAEQFFQEANEIMGRQ